MPTDIYIRDEYAPTGQGDKIVLPEGTIRKKTNVRGTTAPRLPRTNSLQDIEEVKIPPAKTPPFTETERLVPITEFADFAQIAFRVSPHQRREQRSSAHRVPFRASKH